MHKVVRGDEGGMGVEWNEVRSFECIQKLRSLIFSNTRHKDFRSKNYFERRQDTGTGE